MRTKTLLQVAVVTSLEAEEAVVELLARVFRRAAAVYTDEETKITIASIYCERRAEWTPARRAALQAGLKAMRAGGLDIGAGKIQARAVAKEDWSESWKRHFRPIEIGTRLLIKPSWIKRRPRKDQAVVILDPGLSFGTGNHPTTSFCLGEIATGRRDGERQSFWDIGTGSGILAIAAAKLGYAPVRAVDFDPEAVRVARENARRNGVLKAIRLGRQDITQIPLVGRERYDFICANLISNLLVAERRRIVGRLAGGGILVLAGILKEEFAQVQRAYESTGMKLINHKVEGEWCSGTFRRHQ
jgi:ribosomal protein L11 methyltransferase